MLIDVSLSGFEHSRLNVNSINVEGFERVDV